MGKSILILVLLLCAKPALAAFANYNSILFGEQAAGMAGAYTALSGDAAAVSYYNPAALGDLERSSISAAVTVFKKYDTLYGKSDDILSAGLRSNQGFFQSIPSSSSSITRFRKFNFALTFLSPDHSTYSGQVFSDETTASLLSKSDESLWVGPSLGMAISTTEYFGVSLFYTARNFRRTVNDRSVDDNDVAFLFSSDKQLTANSLVAIVGYQKVLDPEWRMGVSIQLPSLFIGGTSSYYESTFDGSTNDLETTNRPSLKAKSPIPPHVRLGFAYRQTPEMLWSIDLSYHGALSYRDVGFAPAADLIEHDPVLNVAFGGEWKARSWLALRGGVFTNFSSHPRPDESKSFRQPSSIDQYGFSANASLVENENIHYTLGGYYTGGIGTSLQNIGQELKEIRTTEQIFTMLFGTSYYF